MKKSIFIVFIIVILFSACSNCSIAKIILAPFRSGISFFTSKKDKLAKELYHAVYSTYDANWVQKVLNEGADPNFCRGECGWLDSNPLNVLSESFYDASYRRQTGEKIPDPIPDVAILNLLIKAGADINRRPYVWNRVNNWNNRFLDQIIKRKVFTTDKSIEPVAVEDKINNYVEDANRLIEAFIKAGADPDMKGHSYPFSSEAMYAKINDEQAKNFFANGSRAINVAIEKGSVWESQVDLLLQYTKLDEESLGAAERSKDPNMIDKISKLWNSQQIEAKEE